MTIHSGQGSCAPASVCSPSGRLARRITRPDVALVGGGSTPRPGGSASRITACSSSTMPEFDRRVLEAAPADEEGRITVSRALRSVAFPAVSSGSRR
jgi:hypothetical protein